MSRKEALNVLRYLTAAYGREVTQDQVEVWWDHLQHYDEAPVMQAARAHVRTSRWFPSVTEICGQIAEARADLPEVQEGVEIILAMVREGHHARRPLLPALEAVVDAIGWQRLTSSTNRTALRAQVRDTYAEIRSRVVRDATLEPGALALPRGHAEEGNRVGGMRSAAQLGGDVLAHLGAGDRTDREDGR